MQPMQSPCRAHMSVNIFGYSNSRTMQPKLIWPYVYYTCVASAFLLAHTLVCQSNMWGAFICLLIGVMLLANTVLLQSSLSFDATSESKDHPSGCGNCTH